MIPTLSVVLRRILVLALLLCLVELSSFAASRKPNIIVFLVDDMGWRDCGAYGSKYYETPNIDKLATRGMRFTDAYSANPLCSPTRASILTGKYPARHGITSATGHQPPQPAGFVYLPETDSPNRSVVTPTSRNYLELSEYTIAEALRDAGYRTGHFGKWHLGLTEQYWPDKQGFDVSLHGKPDPGPPSYFSPYGFRQYQSFPDGPPGEYIMDRLGNEAAKFIEDNKERPFLLHLWSYGVHGPWGHKEEYTKRYAATKDPSGKQGNPIMKSMLKSVDECLGRIMGKLEELKIADDTIIIFTSDNGGNVHSNVAEDAKTQKKKADDPRLADWRKWAGNQPPTSNDPLRNGKGTLYEGGVRIPLIVSWPGVVKPGTQNSTPVCSIDFYLTMLGMAGLQKKADHVVDGKSLIPLLKQTGTLERPALFNYFPHGNAGKPPGATVRAGDWKLIRWYETGPQYPELRELYNLREDLGETKNLAKQMPDKVKELDALIDGFLKDTKALAPKPNPAYSVANARPGATVAAAGDSLLGWVPKSSKTSMVDGALRLEADGKAPFIATVRLAALKHNGPVRLEYRLRTEQGGSGKVQWRTSEQQEFPAGQVVDFNLGGKAGWQEGAVELPVTGQILHVRFYPPLQRVPLDIDWLRLSVGGKATPTPLTWDFGGSAK